MPSELLQACECGKCICTGAQGAGSKQCVQLAPRSFATAISAFLHAACHKTPQSVALRNLCTVLQSCPQPLVTCPVTLCHTQLLAGAHAALYRLPALSQRPHPPEPLSRALAAGRACVAAEQLHWVQVSLTRLTSPRSGAGQEAGSS
jgi:hypothetical protein